MSIWLATQGKELRKELVMRKGRKDHIKNIMVEQ